MSGFGIDDRLFNASPQQIASPTSNVICSLRWRRPRPLTWAVALVVGSVLAYGQFLRVEQPGKTPLRFSIGWPYSYAWKNEPSGALDHIRWRSLAGNIGWWFAMMTPPIIIAERLARSRFRSSAKTLMSASAAAAILLTRPDWLPYYVIIGDEPGDATFELVLRVVYFCWLEIVSFAVISSFAAVCNRSSHPFTLVASFFFIGLVVIGFDVWLYSNGFIGSKNVWEWLDWTLFIGAGVTLLFGALVWLSVALRGIIDYSKKLSGIDSH